MTSNALTHWPTKSSARWLRAAAALSVTFAAVSSLFWWIGGNGIIGRIGYAVVTLNRRELGSSALTAVELAMLVVITGIVAIPVGTLLERWAAPHWLAIILLGLGGLALFYAFSLPAHRPCAGIARCEVSGTSIRWPLLAFGGQVVITGIFLTARSIRQHRGLAIIGAIVAGSACWLAYVGTRKF